MAKLDKFAPRQDAHFVPDCVVAHVRPHLYSVANNDQTRVEDGQTAGVRRGRSPWGWCNSLEIDKTIVAQDDVASIIRVERRLDEGAFTGLAQDVVE